MEVNKIVSVIEKFAPLELQEGWDCSGFQIDFKNRDVKKVLLCLSVTQKIIEQAVEGHYDLIVAHHPLFFVPFSFSKGISIYSAHTNLDKADGGTTDTLIELLGLDFDTIQKKDDFLRVIDLKEESLLDDFVLLLKIKLNIQAVRVVNNLNRQKIKKLAFCAGSGMDFLSDAEQVQADVFVTGDVKYHPALESNAIIIDVGHFESEYPVLKTVENLLKQLDIEVRIADEKSPFINY